MNILSRIRSFFPKKVEQPLPALVPQQITTALRARVHNLETERLNLIEEKAELDRRLTSAIRAAAALQTHVCHLESALAELAGEKVVLEEALQAKSRELFVEREKVTILEVDVGKEIDEKDAEIKRLDALLARAQLEIEEVRSENIRLKGGEQTTVPGTEEDGGNVVAMPAEVVLDATQEMALQLVRISFRDGNKWHFSQGDGELSAPIEDEAFLARLHRREVAFADRDVVRAKVHVKATRAGRKLTTEYRILEVLEIIPPPEQMALAGGAR